MTESSRKIEILAPAGSFDALRAALNSGADAVYFGVGDLNMRAGAAVNFAVEDLPEITRLCHEKNARAYLTLNTIVYDPEMEQMRDLCRKAREAGVDACIAGDMAVILYLREIGMPVHMTVQCNICNVEAVRFYAQFADVMVLARELSLERIRYIIQAVQNEPILGPSGKPVRIEVFAHGALCVAISGKCYMSLSLCGASANRGKCLQPCRRRYEIRDRETGHELVIENEYVMSPKDLCTIEFLDQLIQSGISIFKLEGRGRGPDYVANVVSTYRQAVDACLDGTFTREKAAAWTQKLAEVFNRGFWMGGYYLGKPMEQWCASGGNQSTLQKQYLGKIVKFYSRIGVAECKIESPLEVSPGSRLLIIGSSTGSVDMTVKELRIDGVPAEKAVQGQIFSFPLTEQIRVNNKVYLLTERIHYE